MADHDHNVGRTVDLLWRREATGPRSGPGRRTSVDDLVRAAIDLADSDGLAHLSMRSLAARVGLKPMSLYTYVPNRDVLVALMVDAVAFEASDIDLGLDLAECMRLIAHQYRDELLRHPWLVDVPAWRPVPGPGSSRRYEQQLAALTRAYGDIEVDDVTLDAVIAALRSFATGNARMRIHQMSEHAASGLDDEQWWQIAGPALADAMPPGAYPISSRVGTTVGQLFSGPGNADHAYDFGLTALIAGLARR
ncbi:TetR/AcrR family transcriptional regulator C-terminal domain-containing protein [Gordonia sp. PDNC005]|uniref:TetR/AcrR family transcriptional regulator n=1 Tax=unclassified Gordonia (in: high G+C Gram-positive bacteria) TaxID=2657482 RepID=UPI0019649E1D|nr:TetR/AcrR family transcriptional regulator C-terminal domain-containing protein [Gordonia sp. PDNC005]QRY64412.1 TetR/AcrR family transcriptional regulator C-terminal domain-containing protein [Gordonia sp. PDNC005]